MRVRNRHRPHSAPMLAASPLDAPPTSLRYATAQMPMGNSTMTAWTMCTQGTAIPGLRNSGSTFTGAVVLAGIATPLPTSTTLATSASVSRAYGQRQLPPAVITTPTSRENEMPARPGTPLTAA